MGKIEFDRDWRDAVVIGADECNYNTSMAGPRSPERNSLRNAELFHVPCLPRKNSRAPLEVHVLTEQRVVDP